MMAAKWMVGLLALWTVATAFLLGPQAARWNDIVSGVLLLVAGYWLATKGPRQGWIAAALGMWLAAAAFVPALWAGAALHWHNPAVAAAALLAACAQPRRDVLLHIEHR